MHRPGIDCPPPGLDSNSRDVDTTPHAPILDPNGNITWPVDRNITLPIIGNVTGPWPIFNFTDLADSGSGVDWGSVIHRGGGVDWANFSFAGDVDGG
jgi:hypothetical protein